MARTGGRVDPEAAREAASKLVAAQAARLGALRNLWAHPLGWERGRSRVLAAAAGACMEAAARVSEVRADAATRGESEPYDRATLSETLADALREEGYGLSFKASGWDRYEQYQDDHPRVEASDEMYWLRCEREFQSSMVSWWKPGTPDFDRVLSAWERVDVSGLHEWGGNADLSSALSDSSAMAVAELSLRAGRMDPEPLLAAAMARVEAERAPSPSP